MISFAYCETHPYLEQSEIIGLIPSGKQSSMTLGALRTILSLNLQWNPFLTQNCGAIVINLCYQGFVLVSAFNTQNFICMTRHEHQFEILGFLC